MPDALTQAETYMEQVGLLDAPGAVLYSAAETLRPGPVYLLGLNPGGSGNETLRDSIAASRRGNNAYLDEAWTPGGHTQPIGCSTLQRRIQHLCAAMHLNTRDVPASNLVFTRSTRTGTHLNFGEALQLCRPVHDIFIGTIQPRYLMTFGSIANFREAVSITSIEERSAEHGQWMAYRGEARWGDHRLAFGNVPHMSLWASDKRSHIVDWATQVLRN
jgi:hypothetical protein